MEDVKGGTRINWVVSRASRPSRILRPPSARIASRCSSQASPKTRRLRQASPAPALPRCKSDRCNNRSPYSATVNTPRQSPSWCSGLPFYPSHQSSRKPVNRPGGRRARILGGNDVWILVATESSRISDLSSSPSALEKIFLPPNILASLLVRWFRLDSTHRPQTAQSAGIPVAGPTRTAISREVTV